MQEPSSAPPLLHHLHRILHQERHALLHPRRRGRAAQVMIEELEVAHGEIATVREAAQAVSLARIGEQDRVLLVVAEGLIEIQPFLEGHRRVGGAVHDQDG